MLEKRMKRYYRRLLYGNRSPLARAIDFVAVRGMVFFLGFLWFSYLLKGTGPGLFLAGILTLMLSVILSLIRSLRLEAYVEEKRVQLMRDYLFEQMVLMPRDQFLSTARDLIGAMGYQKDDDHPAGFIALHGGRRCLVCALQNHPQNPVSAQQILECYRMATSLQIDEALLVSISALSPEAREFIHKLPGFSLDIINRAKLLDLAQGQNRLPGRQEVELALIKELDRRQVSFGQLKSEALSASRARSYIICALILFAAGFISGHLIYYPAMGALCLFLAFLSLYKRRARKPESDMP